MIDDKWRNVFDRVARLCGWGTDSEHLPFDFMAVAIEARRNGDPWPEEVGAWMSVEGIIDEARENPFAWTRKRWSILPGAIQYLASNNLYREVYRSLTSSDGSLKSPRHELHPIDLSEVDLDELSISPAWVLNASSFRWDQYFLSIERHATEHELRRSVQSIVIPFAVLCASRDRDRAESLRRIIHGRPMPERARVLCDFGMQGGILPEYMRFLSRYVAESEKELDRLVKEYLVPAK